MPGTGVYFSRIYIYVHIHIFFNQTAALGRQRGCMLLDPPRSYGLHITLQWRLYIDSITFLMTFSQPV